MSIDLAHLLRAAGGSIIGRVRLQKMVYLLDQIGLDSEFEFSYHHYGPYSEELANAMDDAIVFDEVEEMSKAREYDGVTYSVFNIGTGASTPDDPDVLGGLEFSEAREAIEIMSRYSATVLEIAATIHWIACIEEDGDWQTELRHRKGAKAGNGRTGQAMKLLGELGLPPAT